MWSAKNTTTDAGMALKNFRNNAVREELLRRLARMTPDAPPRWGRMNAHQAVVHMGDAFRFGLGEKEAAPLEKQASAFIKWFALNVPVPWPRGFNGPIELLQEGGGTRPQEFERDRQETARLLERYADLDCATSAPHPFFGPLTTRQWGRLVYLHTDHHLRQFGV